MTSLRRGLSAAVLVFFAVSAFALPPGFDVKVTIELRHAPLTRFLEALSTQAKLNFIITDGLEGEKVTAMLHDVTVAEALDVVEEMNGIDYRRIGKSNTYIIAKRGHPALAAPPALDGGPELDRLVTIAVREAPLSRFLDALSTQAKINFAVDDSISEKKITAYLRNVTVREALQVVTAMKGLTVRRLGAKKVYQVTSAGDVHFKVGEKFEKHN